MAPRSSTTSGRSRSSWRGARPGSWSRYGDSSGSRARSDLGVEAGKPAVAVRRPGRPRERGVHVRVGGRRIRGLLADARPVPRRDLTHEVAQAAADAASPSADREDDRRLSLGRDDDVRRARGAVEEVPRGELPLLVLDDECALAGQHEECLLGVLAVVHTDPLARPEDVEVDAEVREPPLALEVAVAAQRAHLAPSGIP